MAGAALAAATAATAGSADNPTMLLHGVPSSSRMHDGLMRKLGDRYHLIAPDYPASATATRRRPPTSPEPSTTGAGAPNNK